MSGQWKPFGDEPIWGDVGETTEVDGVVWANVGPADAEIDKEFHILPMPQIPTEAWEFIEGARAEAMRISGIVPIEVLRSGAVDPRKVRGVCETLLLTEKELKNFLDKQIDPCDDDGSLREA